MTGKRVTTELHSRLCQFEIISGKYKKYLAVVTSRKEPKPCAPSLDADCMFFLGNGMKNTGSSAQIYLNINTVLRIQA